MAFIDPVSGHSEDLARPASEPPATTAVGGGRRGRWPLPLVLAVAVLVPLVGGSAVAGGWAWYHFGSASAAAAFLRGQSLLLEPRAFDLGTVPVGQPRTLKVRASNLTGGMITINGVANFCGRDGCVTALDQFPLEIAPRSTRELTIQIKAPEKGRKDPFRLVTEAYTVVGNREVAFSGRVTDNGTSARP